MTKRDIQRLLVFMAVFGAISALTGCDMATSWIDGGAERGGGDGGAGDDSVRVAGELTGLVTGASGSLTASSLNSAIVTVAGLPIVAAEINVSAVDETTVADDGGFELDLETETDTEHVFLVRGPEDGVGVEQALGFVELPVGTESSTGWDLTGIERTFLDLGSLSRSEESFPVRVNIDDASTEDKESSDAIQFRNEGRDTETYSAAS